MQCPQKVRHFLGVLYRKVAFFMCEYPRSKTIRIFYPVDFFNGNMKVLQPTASLTNSKHR